MKKTKFFLLAAALCTAITALPALAQMKYVAVVETEVDEASGASAKLNKAEVRLITAELRNVAVKNLPRDKYNIMTSETVMSQGSAKLEECAEENCVIALGAKIGADYIVRGIVSKLGASLTMSVEMYETDDGNLVATSGVVRAENIAELLDKTAAVCTDMYKTFVSTQRPAPKTPVTQTTPVTSPPVKPITYTITAAVNPSGGGTVSRSPNQTSYAPGTIVSVTAIPAEGYKFIGWSGASTSASAALTGPIDRDLTLTANFYRQSVQPAARYTPQETGAGQNGGRGGDYEAETENRPMTGFSIGSSFNPSYVGHVAAQLGIVHSRPILEDMLSLNLEGNIWAGGAFSYSGFFGFNVPVTVLLQWYFISLEAGADADLLFGDEQALFNAGFVVGAGVGFSKKHVRRYFYRYCSGYNYGTHVVGMWWLF